MYVSGKPARRLGLLVVGVVAALIAYAGVAVAQPCSITEVRVGGQSGDNYIGPTCNTDGTYRTTFYVKGSGLPGDISTTSVTIEGVTYAPVFFTSLSAGSEIVVGVTGIAGGMVDADVTVDLGGCSASIADLYTAPDCATSCGLTDFRLGGEQGDNYIGPVCNDDGTYRTTFYVFGPGLPGDLAAYTVIINGVPTPVVFLQVLSSSTAVIGVRNVPEGGLTDVTIQISDVCSVTKEDYYEAPMCSCVIDGVRLGGEAGDAYIGAVCNEDETYRACFYVMGDHLPNSAAEASLELEGVPYPIAFYQVLGSDEVVVCATGIVDGPVATDVRVVLEPECLIDMPDLYVGPICQHVEMCTTDPSGVCQQPSPTDDGTNAVPSVTGGDAAVDDFVPSVDADVTHLAWWGIYGKGEDPVTECGPGTGDAFTVTYRADDGGSPGAILAGPMPITNVAKCTTGASIDYGPGQFDEYRYEGDHDPVAVEAGATYWIEITNAGADPMCRWYWRTSQEGSGSSEVDLAFCYNTIRRTCRSAGYYMTHSSTEGGSRNVTGELLETAGCLEICGEVIRTTAVDDADSAVEALCESPRGTQERQLARQLTALGLNCIASGFGPLCAGWPGVEDLFAECNAVCEFGPNGRTVDECIMAVSCANEGGDPFETPGACYTGTCSDNGAPCSSRDKQHCESPSLATCDPDPASCHQEEICNPGLGVCVPPGTSANPTSCKMAKMSACSILEVGRTTELDCAEGIRLDDETCCHTDDCDDGDRCTEDECVVGPGCSNAPIPLCCEENADCSNPLPTCDLATNTCTECVSDADCDDGVDCTLDLCVGYGCESEPGPVIPVPCQECRCDLVEGAVCEPIPGCCVTDADCFDPAAPHCTVFNVCGECGADVHCDDGVDCTADVCSGGDCVSLPDPASVPVLPCQDCRCDLVSGIVCDPIPGCCVDDVDCTDAEAPRCDVLTHTCGECADDVDCDDGIFCTDDVCTDGHCANLPGFVDPPSTCEQNCRCEGGVGRVCDPVPDCCTSNTECTNPSEPICDLAANECAECAGDEDCSEPTPRCNWQPGMGVCVECLVDGDCQFPDEICDFGTCLALD